MRKGGGRDIRGRGDWLDGCEEGVETRKRDLGGGVRGWRWGDGEEEEGVRGGGDGGGGGGGVRILLRDGIVRGGGGDGGGDGRRGEGWRGGGVGMVVRQENRLEVIGEQSLDDRRSKPG